MDSAREALKQMLDMLAGRPDMVRALKPLIGPAEQAVVAEAGRVLANSPAEKAFAFAYRYEGDDEWHFTRRPFKPEEIEKLNIIVKSFYDEPSKGKLMEEDACEHEFRLHPRSSIKICSKCGRGETPKLAGEVDAKKAMSEAFKGFDNE